MLSRSVRRLSFSLGTSIDETIALGVAGIGGIAMLALIESIVSRDGFAVLQRFGWPAASLAVWLGIFHFLPTVRTRMTPRRSGWPAALGLGLTVAASVMIAKQAEGEAWGIIAMAAISYLLLLGTALLRREPIGWALPVLLVIETAAAGTAFLVLPGAYTLPAAAALTVVFAAVFLAVGSLLPGPVGAAAGDLRRLLINLRPYAMLLLIAGGAGAALALVIGGQASAPSHLLVPLAGLAATRLVAEEIMLRVWLMPSIGRRIGASPAILLTAFISAGIALAVRPATGAPLGVVALAFAASLASGVLWRETRSTPAAVIFRLLVS